MSADGLGEGCSQEIRAVDKDRVVGVPGDAVIERSSLVVAGGVLGDSGGIAGEGEGE